MIIPGNLETLHGMSHDEIVAEYRKIGMDEATAETYATVFEKGGADKIPRKD